MLTLAPTPVSAVTASVQRRASSAILLAALATIAFLASSGGGPLLVARLGLSSDIANSIAKAVYTLGAVPW